jgi:hypothetical protein
LDRLLPFFEKRSNVDKEGLVVGADLEVIVVGLDVGEEILGEGGLVVVADLLHPELRSALHRHNLEDDNLAACKFAKGRK